MPKHRKTRSDTGLEPAVQIGRALSSIYEVESAMPPEARERGTNDGDDDEAPDDYDWTCGKKKYDRRCISYLVQTLLTVMVMLFSMIQLLRQDNESSVVWITILSTIAGNAMPSAALPASKGVKK